MSRLQLWPMQRRLTVVMMLAFVTGLLMTGCASQVSEQEKEIRIAVALTQTAVALEPATAVPRHRYTDPADRSRRTRGDRSHPAHKHSCQHSNAHRAGCAGATATVATATVAPTNTVGSEAGGCTNDSTFVEDLSVPDGAVLSASEVVTKSWRVQNSGSCDWSSSYTWKFVEGVSLSPADSVAVVGPVESGEEYDFSIELIAPTQTGRYQGQWRLHDGAGVAFGEAVFYDVTVGDTTTTDVPTIAYFNTNHPVVPPKGQIILSWDVANAFGGVFLRYDGGEEGVTAPGVKTLYPDKTTTYELIARNDSGENTEQVTVEVTTTVATPTPDPAALPTIFYFNATRTEVKPGEQVLLSWDAANAFDGVFLRLADVEEGVIAPGVKAIYPQKDVEYELIARNSNGEARQTLAIEVE
ncbi:MAG: hypothetical protein HC802_17565 [Caldilineaceae bacterium]|nr:hypothetical protein [Caldilineaceae bacterium]